MKIWVIGRHYPALNNRMRGSFEIEQAKMLARGGHEVTYIAVVFQFYKKIRNWGFTSWTEEGITICGYSHPFFPERMNIEMRRFRAAVQKKALRRVKELVGVPDIIHVHYPTMIFDAEAVFEYKKLGCRVFCTEHWTAVQAKTINKKHIEQLKKYVEGANGFICVGEPLREAVQEITQTEKSIEVIPNIVSDLFFPIEREKALCRFEYIVVCRLVKVKQVSKVIEAFARVAELRRDVRLSVIGTGEELGFLMSQSSMLGIDSLVEFTGAIQRTEVAKRIQESDCLICFSSLETFGVPVIEAWACGIPVIASDAVGFKEYWRDGLGFIIDRNDVDGLVECMLAMLDFKPDKEMISRYCQEHFSEDVIRRQLEAIYSRETE